MDITRRDLLKMAGAAVVTAAVGSVEQKVNAAATVKISQAPVIGCKNVTGTKYSGAAAKVYFTKKIDADSLIKL